MKLLVISHTPHYKVGDRLVGWGPTIREVDCLSGVFDEVVHVAPLHQEPAPANSLPYNSSRVRFRAVRPAGGETLRDKLGIIRELAQYLRVICQEMRLADVVQVRSPANVSLVAMVILALLRRPCLRWIKYAGNWSPNSREPWSYAFQRWWLQRGLHRGLVTVNGRWPDQPKHIFSFFNPSLTAEEAKQAVEVGRRKELRLPLNLLFAGRLETDKGTGRVLEIAAGLKQRGLPFELHLLGDGPERPLFEAWSWEHGLDSCITFHGWLPKSALSHFYTRAHFFLLPSASEGWPKVLSEAMAHGVVPLAGAVSSIPQILSETGAGLALPPLEVEAFMEALVNFAASPGLWKLYSRSGMAAAGQFTYDYYLQSLNRMFQEAWNISLPAIKQAGSGLDTNAPQLLPAC